MTDRGTAAGDGANIFGTAFLAAASGSADVITFLTLGHVFGSAMTGNTALLGIAIADGNLLTASQPATALLAFVAGGVLGAAIYNPNAPVARQRTTLRLLLVLEIACLCAFAALWHAGTPTAGSATHYALIILCAAGMGLQGIAAKRINAPGVNTIVFTSTLVAIVLSVTEIVLGRVDTPAVRAATKGQIAAFAAYAAGALLAGLLDWSAFALLTWVPATAVILALAAFELDRPPTRT